MKIALLGCDRARGARGAAQSVGAEWRSLRAAWLKVVLHVDVCLVLIVINQARRHQYKTSDEKEKRRSYHRLLPRALPPHSLAFICSTFPRTKSSISKAYIRSRADTTTRSALIQTMRACRRLLAAVAAPHRHQPAGAHSALSSSPAAPLRLVCCRMMGHGSHMSDNRCVNRSWAAVGRWRAGCCCAFAARSAAAAAARTHARIIAAARTQPILRHPPPCTYLSSPITTQHHQGRMCSRRRSAATSRAACPAAGTRWAGRLAGRAGWKPREGAGGSRGRRVKARQCANALPNNETINPVSPSQPHTHTHPHKHRHHCNKQTLASESEAVVKAERCARLAMPSLYVLLPPPPKQS